MELVERIIDFGNGIYTANVEKELNSGYAVNMLEIALDHTADYTPDFITIKTNDFTDRQTDIILKYDTITHILVFSDDEQRIISHTLMYE